MRSVYDVWPGGRETLALSPPLTVSSLLRISSLVCTPASMSARIDPLAKMAPDPEEQEQLREQVAEDTRGILSYFWPFHPLQLAIDLLWALGRLFRPLAPHLIPLAVFSAILPLIIFLSIGSGYLVWKSVAVSWENDLFLQYGYVAMRVSLRETRLTSHVQ